MFNNQRLWFEAWFEVLDSLFCILTFGFWYIDLTGWWFFNCTLGVFRRRHCYIGDHITFWFFAWKWLLKSILKILTLGYL